MPLAVLTVNNVPILLRSLLGSRGADISNLRSNRILALVNPALETMAYRIAHGADYRGLQKQFAGLTPHDGWLERGDMGDAMIFDMARSIVTDTNTNAPLVPVDSWTTLVYGDLPTGQIYYAQDGADLRFRDALGSLGTYFGDVTIRANYIPALAQVPAEYHGLFLDTLAELITELRPAIRTQELSEAGRA